MLHHEDQRSRKVRERAYTLADSGLHSGWRSIDQTLIAEGWPESRAVMDSEYFRLTLDERCAAAREHAPAS